MVQVALIALFLFVVLRSLVVIRAGETGLVIKKISNRNLKADNPIAFEGEAGYQAGLLLPGLHFRLWPFFIVRRHAYVQVPSGTVGVVISQVGLPLEQGAKSSSSAADISIIQDLKNF